MLLTAQHINNIKIAGRLGNQMFIIASIIGLAKSFGCNYGFPNWKYNKQFNSNLPFYLKDEDDKIINISESCHGLDNMLTETIRHHSNMNGFMNIQGYLQDYKYFDSYKDLILKTFNYERNPIQNTCSIHIRRGDYVKLPNHHPCCPLDYYKNASKYIRDNTNVSKFLIFSDDIEWCKESFKGNNIEFIPQRDEVDDMIMMANCEHNIIANSSYSWWAAYLNTNPNKIIIKPKKWFGTALSNHNTNGYNVNGWIEL